MGAVVRRATCATGQLGLATGLSLVCPLGLVVDGVWCGLMGRRAVVLPLIARLADLDATWSRALLTPTPEALRTGQLAARVEELTATRAGAAAAHGAELRRIERDLHDGAQARLVALSMRLGLARRAYDADPEAARTLLDDAQDQAEGALAELRHVVRGSHPPVLTDRGLAGAVRALAAGSGLSVEVREDGLAAAPRAPAAVEAAAYFVVAEALTNTAKHSGADRAAVELARTPSALREGLVLLLTSAGHEVAAVAATGPEVLPALLAHRPNVAVLDVRMPPGLRDEGLRAALTARREVPGQPVLVLSQYVEETYAAELLADGASGVGYLLKDRIGRVDAFLDALQRVAAGGTALDPDVVTELLARRRDDPLDSLTPRKREVLHLMAQGRDFTRSPRPPGPAPSPPPPACTSAATGPPPRP